MFLFLYRILLIVAAPVMVLALLIRSINHPAYRYRLLERLGIVTNHITTGSIIVHAASVGEVIAVKAYVENLLARNLAVTVTTFTPTGSAQVKKQFGDRVQHCYLPLDIWPCTALFLHSLKPSAFVLMETELWPNLIHNCHSKRIPLQLINGRLSDKSMKSYQKIRGLIAPALKRFNKILCQSEAHYQNFISLGAMPHQCQISGNLKFDITENQEITDKAAELKLLMPQGKVVWLVASTHEGDEALALSAFEDLYQKHPELLLIIVPRHPERFNTARQLATQANFQTQLRSTNEPIASTTQVWVMDSLGELMSAYKLADFVTIGGSFSSVGGHNPLEPALFKKPIIVGHDMSNFKEIEQQLQQSKGIIKLKPGELQEGLVKELSQLIELPQTGQLLGENAFSVVAKNQGASGKSADALYTILYT